MKAFLIVALLIASTFCLTPQDLVGYYDIGKQCESSPCPRTTYGKYNFACPLNGENGQIFSVNYGTYAIGFKTYNMIGSNKYFEANFTADNIVHDYSTGQGQVQIHMSGGYVLNIMPCYNGKSTSSVCKIAGTSQLAIWKTDRRGNICEGCAFSMTRYQSLQQAEEEEEESI